MLAAPSIPVFLETAKDVQDIRRPKVSVNSLVNPRTGKRMYSPIPYLIPSVDFHPFS
jgi:hypothetical protein